MLKRLNNYEWHVNTITRTLIPSYMYESISLWEKTCYDRIGKTFLQRLFHYHSKQTINIIIGKIFLQRLQIHFTSIANILSKTYTQLSNKLRNVPLTPMLSDKKKYHQYKMLIRNVFIIWVEISNFSKWNKAACFTYFNCSITGYISIQSDVPKHWNSRKG